MIRSLIAAGLIAVLTVAAHASEYGDRPRQVERWNQQMQLQQLEQRQQRDEWCNEQWRSYEYWSHHNGGYQSAPRAEEVGMKQSKLWFDRKEAAYLRKHKHSDTARPAGG